jgi:hypothetical protein
MIPWCRRGPAELRGRRWALRCRAHGRVQGLPAVRRPHEDAGGVPQLTRGGDLAGVRWRGWQAGAVLDAVDEQRLPWLVNLLRSQPEASRTARERGPSSSTPAGRPVARVSEYSRLSTRGYVGGEGMSRGWGNGAAPVGSKAGCGRWGVGAASGGVVGGSGGWGKSGWGALCVLGTGWDGF